MNTPQLTKLLIIAPQNPYPPTDGGKIGIYSPLIYMPRYFQVHFAFITPTPVPESTFEHFRELGIQIYPQVLNTEDAPIGYVTNFLKPLPYKFSKYCKSHVLQQLQEIVKKEGIESVWCNHAHVAWYGLQLKSKLGVNIFLREHNIEYALVQQVLAVQSNFLVKLLVKYQARKTERLEQEAWKRFDKVFFISNSDFNIACSAVGRQEHFRLLYDSFHHAGEITKLAKEPFSLIFTANLSTFQNLYNIRKFITEIWLPLLQKDRRWKLYITGNKVGEVARQLKLPLAENNIIDLGFVDNIEATVAGKKYFISPTYMGSGVRIKVLNAMSAGAVCLVSMLDHEMLEEIKDGYNVMKFESFDEFYHKLLSLECDEEQYISISSQAKKVISQFSWSTYIEILRNEI